MLSPTAPGQIRPTVNYNGVDLVKFLCAILVFMIHVPPFGDDPSGLQKYIQFGLHIYLCRLAVPFYFVCSGYFLFRKMPLYALDTNQIRDYCFKILRLLGIWTILLFAGKTVHLWYLQGTVIAVVILNLCLRLRLRLPMIWVMACGLYAIGLLGDSYYGLTAGWTDCFVIKLLSKGYGLFFHTTRNGVFMGFIFILMGATLAIHPAQLQPRTTLAGLVLSMLCLFVEAILLQYHKIPADHNMYIFLLPAVFFLFSLATGITLKNRPVYRHLRDIGTLLYFTHVMVDHCVGIAISVLGNTFGIDIRSFQFVLSLLFTLLLAICIESLSHRERFKWLRWLLS